MKRLILLLIAFSFVCSANICMAGDSLEAKLAKLEAATKAEQSGNEIVIEKPVSRKKTLAKRIDELEAQQKTMQAVDEGLINRMSGLEGKLVALESRPETQPDEALLSRITELERKLEQLESSQESAEVSRVISDLEPIATARVLTTSIPVAKSVAANYLETTFVEPDENAVSIDITADYFSKYIWRGQNYNDDPVVQPSISVSYGGLTAAIWGSFDTTNYTGNSGDFYELDYSLDYTAAMPGMEGVDYSIGVIYYDYPGSGIFDTTETYVGLSFDLPLSPSVTFYNDMDEAEGGSYISFAVGHSIEKIAELTPDIPIGMDIGASLGWGSASYNKYYWGTNQSKMQDLAVSVSFPMEIGVWTFAPSLNYVTLLSDDIRATDINRSESDYFYAGVSLSKSF